MNASVGVCVPTYNAGSGWEEWIRAFKNQTYIVDDVLVIDSSSSDQTVDLCKSNQLNVEIINKKTFNHGGTRQFGVNLLSKSDIIIFLTQDAILASDRAIEKIIEVFGDQDIGAAYGRQLPRKGAGAIESHARLYNYPTISITKSIKDKNTLGIKVAFISNSFAAYKKEYLLDVGGFPSNTILSEDMYVAAKMLMKGWKIAYCAESCVYHSHDYTFIEEFKRYFDIGVFHAREPWIREEFGSAEGEGKKYIISEIKYLLKKQWHLIPSSLFRNALKYIGYRLGANEKLFTDQIKAKLSMHKKFWNT